MMYDRLSRFRQASADDAPKRLLGSRCADADGQLLLYQKMESMPDRSQLAKFEDICAQKDVSFSIV